MARLRLEQTCGGCPERYDVYQGDECIGYMRLRHGHFYAEYRGETVYEASPRGDGLFTYEERDYYLSQACNAILAAAEGDGPEELYEITYPKYE